MAVSGWSPVAPFLVLHPGMTLARSDAGTIDRPNRLTTTTVT